MAKTLPKSTHNSTSGWPQYTPRFTLSRFEKEAKYLSDPANKHSSNDKYETACQYAMKFMAEKFQQTLKRRARLRDIEGKTNKTEEDEMAIAEMRQGIYDTVIDMYQMHWVLHKYEWRFDIIEMADDFINEFDDFNDPPPADDE